MTALRPFQPFLSKSAWIFFRSLQHPGYRPIRHRSAQVHIDTVLQMARGNSQPRDKPRDHGAGAKKFPVVSSEFQEIATDDLTGSQRFVFVACPLSIQSTVPVFETLLSSQNSRRVERPDVDSSSPIPELRMFVAKHN